MYISIHLQIFVPALSTPPPYFIQFTFLENCNADPNTQLTLSYFGKCLQLFSNIVSALNLPHMLLILKAQFQCYILSLTFSLRSLKELDLGKQWISIKGPHEIYQKLSFFEAWNYNLSLSNVVKYVCKIAEEKKSH